MLQHLIHSSMHGMSNASVARETIHGSHAWSRKTIYSSLDGSHTDPGDQFWGVISAVSGMIVHSIQEKPYSPDISQLLQLYQTCQIFLKWSIIIISRRVNLAMVALQSHLFFHFLCGSRWTGIEPSIEITQQLLFYREISGPGEDSISHSEDRISQESLSLRTLFVGRQIFLHWTLSITS